MSESCQLTEGPCYQCCCNCKHHWQDFHHCTIRSEVQATTDGCCCSEPKGWICVGMRVAEGVARVHSSWPEHSVGCELYTPIRRIER